MPCSSHSSPPREERTRTIYNLVILVQKYCRIAPPWDVQFLGRALSCRLLAMKYPGRASYDVVLVVVSIVDLGAVVPVEAPHLGVHDALVRGGKRLGRGHVLVVPCVAVAEITCKY